MEAETESLLPAHCGGQSHLQRGNMTGCIQVPRPLNRVYKVYKRRWLMLFIFFLYSMVNSAQWIEYSIISNVVQHYYNESSLFVDMTSTVYMIVFPFLIYPASILLDKMGLRTSLIIGSLGTALGAWVKCAAVAPDRFWLLFLGQTIVAMCQVFILGVPPHLASVWFGSDQVSTACSLALFGNQVGVAIGFIMPPLIMHNHPDADDFGVHLSVMNFIVAGSCTLVFIIVLFLFQKKPPLPPSLEMLRREEVVSDWIEPLKRLFKNRGYVLLALTFSINVAVFSAFCTLLNQLMFIYFDDGDVVAGVVGLIVVASGMLGCLICGVVLDKTHRFKETCVILYAISTLSMVALTFVLSLRSVWAVYGVSVLVGGFSCAIMPVGFEFASELTYPETESTTAGLMTGMSQILGVLITILYGRLLEVMGDVWANLCLSWILALGLLFTVLIPSKLKRQAAHAAALSEVENMSTSINA